MNVNLSSIITPLRSLWDDLVERRLWPVAIVLVVGLVAIPVLLSKSAKPVAPPAAPPAGTGTASPTIAFQAAVSTDGKKSSEIRKNLRSFRQKNPFTPQGLSTGGGSTGATGAAGTATPSATSAQSASSGASTGSSSSSTGSSGSGATTHPSTTVKTFYYHYTVNVLFGKKGSAATKTLSEFRALPDSNNPVLVFMGVKSDGKTAVFLVSAKASTSGDGKCSPSDTECTFLYMTDGNKETIEVVDTAGAITDYTLELKSISVKRTNAPQKAQAKSSKVARAAARRQSRAKLVRIENSFRLLGL